MRCRSSPISIEFNLIEILFLRISDTMQIFSNAIFCDVYEIWTKKVVCVISISAARLSNKQISLRIPYALSEPQVLAIDSATISIERIINRSKEIWCKCNCHSLLHISNWKTARLAHTFSSCVNNIRMLVFINTLKHVRLFLSYNSSSKQR